MKYIGTRDKSFLGLYTLVIYLAIRWLLIESSQQQERDLGYMYMEGNQGHTGTALFILPKRVQTLISPVSDIIATL